MAELTPPQEKRRAAVETLIRLTEPGLNLILAAGDRISRLVEPEDHEYYPARPLAEREPVGAPSGAEPAKHRTGAEPATRSTTRPASKPKPAAGSAREQGAGDDPQR